MYEDTHFHINDHMIKYNTKSLGLYFHQKSTNYWCLKFIVGYNTAPMCNVLREALKDKINHSLLMGMFK